MALLMLVMCCPENSPLDHLSTKCRRPVALSGMIRIAQPLTPALTRAGPMTPDM